MKKQQFLPLKPASYLVISILILMSSCSQAPKWTEIPGEVFNIVTNEGGATLGYSPNLRHGVTGQGLNDYDSIFRILAEHHYQGWISIEDGMNGMDEMAQSLAFLRRMIAEHFPQVAT